ncbi:DMT family transporter [Roseococcus sp. SYP-B2431]|uniref:DMT family transporter n=1 Tax=Roseococcus sp. SYP-B2431 TaxID=2496640 RepID=UPI00103D8404|nr:DMT family transporter [Roseococcus sp. SYP-B2431]TCH96124.1 DMT family transporter [Roseococcus sp. SYP-B2431]
MSQGRALQLLLLVVVFFGGIWPLTKHAYQFATPLWFGFGRAGLAAVATGAVMAALGRLHLPPRHDWPVIATLGLLQIGGFFALSHMALAMVPAGRTAILCNVTTYWLVPLSVWILKEKVSPLRWAAAGIGLLGILVMMGPWAIDWSAPGMLLGHGMLLASALFWSIAIVVTRLRPPTRPILELLPWVFAVAALVVLLPLALWREPFSAGGGVGGPALWAVAFIGLVAAPIGTWANVEAARHLNAVLASVGFLLVPVFGVALAVVWLGEPLGWDLILGGSLVLLSVVLAARG